MYKSKNYYTLIKGRNKNSSIWEYYCYDKNGKRVHRSTGQKRRADALAVIEERIANDELIYPKGFRARTATKGQAVAEGILMKDFCKDMFIYEKCPITKDALARGRHIAKTTCISRKYFLERAILPYLGDFRVADLTAPIIDRWLLNLPEKNNIARASANNCLSALSTILTYAVQIGLIESNPCRKVKKLGNDSKEKAVFTDEYIELLFKEPWKENWAEMCCYLSSNTGMRAGEVLALQGYQIHENYILIDASVTQFGERKSTKNGKPRTVPISEAIYSKLNPLIRGDNDYLFTKNGTDPMKYQTLKDILRRRLKKAGLGDKGLTFHSFRHYFNTKLVASGIRAEKIRAVIGHESEAMTEHYLHLTAEDMKEITSIQR
nr:MAG TPA: Integrase [Caudoviricetes sp.]